MSTHAATPITQQPARVDVAVHQVAPCAQATQSSRPEADRQDQAVEGAGEDQQLDRLGAEDQEQARSRRR